MNVTPLLPDPGTRRRGSWDFAAEDSYIVPCFIVTRLPIGDYNILPKGPSFFFGPISSRMIGMSPKEPSGE